MESLNEVTPVVELLNNFLFLASAYNQIWNYQILENGALGIIDERSGEVKAVFYNPDERMQKAVQTIAECGWVDTKHNFLVEATTLKPRVYICDANCTCECHNI